MLVLQVLSTWGDPHYVGLNGIDIFDDEGNEVVSFAGGIAVRWMVALSLIILKLRNDRPPMRSIAVDIDARCFTIRYGRIPK